VKYAGAILDPNYAAIKILAIKVVTNVKLTQDLMNAAELIIFIQAVMFVELTQDQKIVAHNKKIIQAVINAE
jgi:hypothetical protein